MKKTRVVSTFFLILLLFYSPLFSEDVVLWKRADAPYISGEHFLLTYARSGTNLTSCYLQYFTGIPIRFLFDDRPYLAENRLSVPIDYSKLTLYRTHYPKDLRKIDKQSNKLLYVLRNYKEALYRHNYQRFKTPEAFRDFFKKNTPIVKEYMEGLQIYDEWDPDLRLMVHYEDLLTDPVTVMRQVLVFFNEPVPDFLTRELLKEIGSKALDSYHNQHKSVGGSHSKGEDLLYHTRKLPTNILREIDSHVKSNYPLIWNNYLKRYQS